MATVSFCLLPVVALGHRFSKREITVTIGVLRGVMAATWRTTWTSVVLTTMSIGKAATSGEVCGLSQNSSVVLPPFVFTRMEQKRNVLNI